MEVSLPALIMEWAEAQARNGRYTSVSDYVGELIRRDQERAQAFSELQEFINEGLYSGVSTRSMADLLEEARTRVKTASTQ